MFFYDDVYEYTKSGVHVTVQFANSKFFSEFRGAIRFVDAGLKCDVDAINTIRVDSGLFEYMQGLGKIPSSTKIID